MRETTIKDKIFTHQAIFLITIYRSMTPLTFAPLLKTEYANQDIWIIVLLSVPYTILFCFPLLYLSNKFSGMNLLEYTEKIMGKFIGRILAVVYGILFLLCLIFFTSVFVEILNSALYPNTPPWVNLSILIVTVLYIVSKGLINMARLSEIIFPILLFTFIMLLLLGFEVYDFDFFLPILKDSTFKQLNLGAMYNSVLNIDTLILVMIASNLEKKKDIYKIFVHSLIYTTFVIILSTVAIQATLGVAYTKHVSFPFYNFTRLIRIGDTIGFDLLYIIIWMIGVIYRISGYFYTTTAAFGKIFNIRNQRSYIPILIIVTTAALYIQSKKTIVTERRISQLFIIIVGVTGILAIPLILLITYLFRRKSFKDPNQSTEQ